MKFCKKCNENKKLCDFSIRTDTGKLRGQCKKCVSNNRKQHYQKNKDVVLEQNKKWYENNKQKMRQINDRWRKNNKEKHRFQSKIYRRRKLQEDLNFKISDTLRSRVGSAIRNQYGSKAFSTIDLLGCSIDQLKEHLEKQFQDGMNWNNHSRNGWHIDHIKPCSSFDLTDSTQQKECFNYKNLQPLWAGDNLSKGNKIYESNPSNI